MSLFQTTALKRMFDNFGVSGSDRHKLAQKVISTYRNSRNPFDILAVAMAYQWEGAAFRPMAIEFYESFISTGATPEFFSYWQIYSDLAILYEREYEFDAAVRCLERCKRESNYQNPADFTRIGDIFVKQNIDYALEYYQNLLKTPYYKQHKIYFDAAYNEVLNKKKNGYVYKPRKNKPPKHN